jgi:hypothetical protein
MGIDLDRFSEAYLPSDGPSGYFHGAANLGGRGPVVVQLQHFDALLVGDDVR